MKAVWTGVLVLMLAGLALAVPANQDSPQYGEMKQAYLDAVQRLDAGLTLSAREIALLKAFEHHEGNTITNEIDEAGGPDAMGYSYIDSQETGGPTYEWIDISDNENLAELYDLSDDDSMGPFDFGFNFSYYAESYGQFYIQSNGTINFDDSYVSLGNNEMPYDGYGALVAWFWDDLDPDSGLEGEIYMETMMVGDQNACVVSFHNYDEFNGGPDTPNVTAQVIFFQNGDIKMQYNNFTGDFDFAGGTVGIQDQTGTVGMTVTHNGSVPNYPFDGLALLFTRGEPDAIVSGTITDSGNNLPIAGAEVSIGSGFAVTDASGSYTLESYSLSDASISVEATGYYAYSGSMNLVEGANEFSVALNELPPPQDDNYFSDFEDDQGFFESAGIFAHAAISVDPGSAHSGSMAWDLAPNALYENNMDEWMISSPSWEIGEGTPYISYWHWFSFEPNYDGYNFKVSTDGGETWEVLIPNEGYTDDDGVWGNDNAGPVFTNNADRHEVWEQLTFDLSAYIGEQVWFGWNAHSDGSVTYPGVCIDDVEINVGENGPGADLELTGVETIIPPSGGTVIFDASFVSDYPNTVPGLVFWTTATLPNGNSTQPLLQVPFTHTPFMNVFMTGMQQAIPAFAPGGQYSYNGFIGFTTANPLVSDSFGFEKIGTAVDGDISFDPADWPARNGQWIARGDDAAAEASVLPATFALSPAFPNPFNPTATVSVSLPNTAELTVGVFNVMGQQVAELANGSFNAGQHQFVVDGSGLSSGVYFIQASVPGELNAIQKVTLMK